VKRTQSVICMLAALLVSLSLNVGWNGTAGATTWPKNLAGRLLVHSQTSVPFGSLVTVANLRGGLIFEKTYL
jgi:hypothetical protein